MVFMKTVYLLKHESPTSKNEVIKVFGDRERGIDWLKRTQGRAGGTFTDVTVLSVEKTISINGMSVVIKVRWWLEEWVIE